MSKFKVGDKVKIIGKSYSHDFKIGSVGTIGLKEMYDSKHPGDYKVSVDGISYTQIIEESALELISIKPKLSKNATKWVEALRSGKFKQTKGILKYQDAFCGLGVACEVYRKTRKKGFITWVNYTILGSAGTLPLQVQKWLGLKNEYARTDKGTIQSVTALNDNGASFSKIADFIEQNADSLFVKE